MWCRVSDHRRAYAHRGGWIRASGGSPASAAGIGGGRHAARVPPLGRARGVTAGASLPGVRYLLLLHRRGRDRQIRTPVSQSLRRLSLVFRPVLHCFGTVARGDRRIRRWRSGALHVRRHDSVLACLLGPHVVARQSRRRADVLDDERRHSAQPHPAGLRALRAAGRRADGLLPAAAVRVGRCERHGTFPPRRAGDDAGAPRVHHSLVAGVVAPARGNLCRLVAVAADSPSSPLAAMDGFRCLRWLPPHRTPDPYFESEIRLLQSLSVDHAACPADRLGHYVAQVRNGRRRRALAWPHLLVAVRGGARGGQDRRFLPQAPDARRVSDVGPRVCRLSL